MTDKTTDTLLHGYPSARGIPSYASRGFFVKNNKTRNLSQKIPNIFIKGSYNYNKGLARIPLDFPFAEAIEITQITTTTQNLVTYTQRVEFDALVEFMREDRTERRAAAKSKEAQPDE